MCIRDRLSIDDKKDCPRYIGAVVSNVTVKPSPEWMQERLIAVGQRPINNLVDISNYILMEIGQPTHIFDWDKIDTKEILVRRASKNETITTLDQNSVKLNENHLLITDGKKPIAIAGVMGGFDSAVSDETQTIFIESAYFDPITIRKSSKSLSLSTEASKRYERGADPDIAILAFWRILSLIEDYAGGLFDGEFLDLFPGDIEKSDIKVRSSEIEQILGLELGDEKITNILEGLGFSVSVSQKGIFKCKAPSYRPDVEREIDIIEELARINGYDNIPVDNSLYGTFIFEETDPQLYLQNFRDKLSGLGFYQHYSNSLQDKSTANLFGQDSIPMMNPLSKNMAHLRTSLYPGLLKAAELNIKNSSKSFKLYELGCVHSQKGSKIEHMKEEIRLTGIISGNERQNSVHSENDVTNIFSIKGVIKTILGDDYFNDLEFFIDPSRCIGCQACVQACGECDTHRGTPMIHLDYVDRPTGVQTTPVVCMHCEDPTCAKVCPADAIKQDDNGVVLSAASPRCVSCSNCTLACPFGVPKQQIEMQLMMKCDMCYDRTSVGKKPMCATVCPSPVSYTHLTLPTNREV